jgi:hypothetical protein
MRLIADYFKATGDDRIDHLLRHDRESDAWCLIVPDGPATNEHDPDQA